MATKSAIILAGGKGSRLRTFDTVKPLVKAGPVPLILWNIRYLQEAGVKKITIVVPRRDTLIKRELLAHPEITANISFIEQPRRNSSMLDSVITAGALMAEPFFVTVCDVLFEKNPYRLFRKMPRRTLCAVLVGDDLPLAEYSGANVKVAHKGERFIKAGTALAPFTALEAGVYHFTPQGYRILADIATANPKSKTLDSAFSRMARRHAIMAVRLGNIQWFDVNTPATLIRAEVFFRKNGEGRTSRRRSVRQAPLPIQTHFRYKKALSFEVNMGRGLLRSIEKYELIPHESYYSPHHLIVDKNLYARYGKPLERKLKKLGYRISVSLVDPGEWSKSVEQYVALAEKILTAGIDKKSFILALGGGVVKDLAGFLASTLYRGIGFISIPTTVLSQCDAAIALKQGVNGPGGKNLLGSFYPPFRVVVDPEVLRTLDKRYVSDGLAEAIKQALAQDKKFFRFFKNYTGSIRDLSFLERVIRTSGGLKLRSIEKDFYEDAGALVYQYGHEIGHALEYLSGYHLGHGEAVAIGMRVSAELAELLNIAAPGLVAEHLEMLSKYGLPTDVPADVSASDIIQTLRYNKKFHGGEARFVLVCRIGELWHEHGRYTVPVGDALIHEAVERSRAKAFTSHVR